MAQIYADFLKQEKREQGNTDRLLPALSPQRLSDLSATGRTRRGELS